MDALDRHNGKKDKQTNEWKDGRTHQEMRLFVRPILRWNLTHTV